MALDWEADLAEAEAELAGLEPARLLADAHATAVTWRPIEPFGGFGLPLPLIARETRSTYGGWTDPEDHHGRTDGLALDERGRVIAHVLDAGDRDERIKHFWRWEDDGSFVEIELMGSGPHVRRARADEDGRIVHVATASSGGSTAVRTLAWRDGHAVEMAQASRWGQDHGQDLHVIATLRDGAVWQLRSGSRETDATLAEGLAQAQGIEPERLIWDGRLLQPEPWPGAEAAADLVEPLAAALDAAYREAAQGVDDTFLLEIPERNGDGPFPPHALLASARWRDGMRAASREDGEAMRALWRGLERGHVTELRITDHLDDDALRACRVLSTAMRTGARWSVQRAAAPVADAVGERLAELLNATPLPGAVEPFLALVHLAGTHPEHPRGLDRARRVTGDAHVERFLASVASSRTATPAGDVAAPADRGALAAELAATPLAGHATRLASDVAREALLLEPATGARSRLGGPPLLPVGAEWPVSEDGGSLTFLAALDLAELPVTARPSSGWLLFFAEIDPDGHGGLLDVATNEPGSVARVLFAEEVAAAECRGDELSPRPVAARRILVLPDDYEAAQRAGLDVFEAEAYEEAARRLLRAAGVPGWGDGVHWAGGPATGAQGHPPEANTTLLLHLGWDPALGFCFADGGDVQFRIPDEALVARDWSQAFALADSG